MWEIARKRDPYSRSPFLKQHLKGKQFTHLDPDHCYLITSSSTP
jgi:hypothetical protein